MVKEIVGGLLGVGVAIAIIVFIVSKLSKKEIDNEVLDSLFNEKTETTFLNGKDLAIWFKAKIEGKSESVKMILSYIDTELLIKYGFTIKGEVKIQNIVAQFLYDETASKVVENRLIRFDNIDTNLQAQLEENDGLIVFSK